jgi:hypothetical protein
MKLPLPAEPFDHLLLMSRLNEYNDPNGKIMRMVNDGEILKLKKGLYISATSNTNLFSIANLLYAPSYVSMETALSYWGLIPEKVTNITSITNKRKKEFHNQKGNFYYNSIKSKSLHLGILYESNGRFLIANRSKAVCDYLKVKKIKYGDIVAFLENDLRIDIDEIATLDKELVLQLGTAYKSQAIKKLYRQLRKL